MWRKKKQFEQSRTRALEQVYWCWIHQIPTKPEWAQYLILVHFYPRLLLRHCFEQLRSTQVAVVHCSAQTSPMHVLQKLQQSCMVISSNTGRVYRPKDCERLVLYLKDLNLPKPDKWGTSQLIAFLQQVKLVLLTFLFLIAAEIKLIAK